VNAKPKMRAPLTIVWEFRVPEYKRAEFESAYGPDGLWAQFFRRGEGYIRTGLYRDTKVEGRYFTLDYWRSRAAFYSFKEHNLAAYKSLDQQCSTLTAEEKFLAEYETLEQVTAFLASHGFPCTNVRPACPADLPAIFALERSSPSAAHWPESAYRALFDPHAPQRIALVLEDNKQQVHGVAIARIFERDCELENIVVEESSRRNGYGRMLLHTVIAAATLQRITQILLEVRESNHVARSFYERLGFEFLGRRRSYYTNPLEDALNYRLLL
jgi:ribosomal-protein-alanine N-acetyltransferase